MQLSDSFDDMMFLHYYPDENIFYDECGKQIENIFEILTADDLLLFKKDPRRKYFVYCKNKHVLCKILIKDGEGEDYHEERMDLHYDIYNGFGCWFFDHEKGFKRTICESCSGGD